MNWRDLGLPLLMWLLLALTGGVVWVVAWSVTGARCLLPLRRGWRVSWTGPDALAVFLIFHLTQLAVYLILAQVEIFQKPPAGARQAIPGEDQLWTALLSLPLQVGLVLAALWLARGVRPARLGLTGRRWGPNFLAGFLLWLVVTPPLNVLYFSLLQLIPAPASFLKDLDLGVYGWLLLLSVCFAAPLAEELVFRGVLLPWSLNVPLDRQLVIGVGAALMAWAAGFKRNGDFDAAPVIFVVALLPGFLLLPYLVLRKRSEAPALDEQDAGRKTGLVGWSLRLVETAQRPEARPLLAIYGNGLLFGAVHSSMWPAPIPLMLLGVALAWLSYRTRSLVGPILVHALFNGVTFLTLLWEWWN